MQQPLNLTIWHHKFEHILVGEETIFVVFAENMNFMWFFKAIRVLLFCYPNSTNRSASNLAGTTDIKHNI